MLDEDLGEVGHDGGEDADHVVGALSGKFGFFLIFLGCGGSVGPRGDLEAARAGRKDGRKQAQEEVLNR